MKMSAKRLKSDKVSAEKEFAVSQNFKIIVAAGKRLWRLRRPRFNGRAYVVQHQSSRRPLFH